jgi:hypothetical protein
MYLKGKGQAGGRRASKDGGIAREETDVHSQFHHAVIQL